MARTGGEAIDVEQRRAKYWLLFTGYLAFVVGVYALLYILRICNSFFCFVLYAGLS